MFMSTLTIDPKIYHYAEMFAQRENISITEMVEKVLIEAFTIDTTLLEENNGQIHSWKDYNVSPEVMNMTFADRKDIPLDYKEEYFCAIRTKE